VFKVPPAQLAHKVSQGLMERLVRKVFKVPPAQLAHKVLQGLMEQPAHKVLQGLMERLAHKVFKVQLVQQARLAQFCSLLQIQISKEYK